MDHSVPCILFSFKKKKKIDHVHSTPNLEDRKGFSHQSDHRHLNGRRFIFVNFVKMGTWSVSQKRSGLIQLLLDNLSHAEVSALYLQS